MLMTNNNIMILIAITTILKYETYNNKNNKNNSNNIGTIIIKTIIIMIKIIPNNSIIYSVYPKDFNLCTQGMKKFT